MHYGTLLATLSLSTLVVGDYHLTWGDVPVKCLAACHYAVNQSNKCWYSDYKDYGNCFCNVAETKPRVDECASCMKACGMMSNNVLAELMDECDWSYASASTTYPTSTIFITSTVSGSTAATSGVTDSTAAAVTTSVATLPTTSAGTTHTSGTNTASASTSVATAGAPVVNVGVGGVAVGLLMGLHAML